MNEIKTEFADLKAKISELLSKLDRSKFTHLQNYIYFAHYPVFSFTDSIIILCEKGKPKVAKVLLRSLFEVHMDVIYHQVGDSEQRLALSAKRSFDERITMLNEIAQLIEKYPHLKSPDPTKLFSESYLKNTIAYQEEYRAGILRGNPSIQGLKKVHLQEKAKACDEGSVKNAEGGHFQRMYSLIYRQLSPVAHLNVEGLQEFMGQDDSGKVFFSDEDNSDFIMGQALGISLAFIRDLYDNGILDGEPPESVGKIEKKLGEVN